MTTRTPRMEADPIRRVHLACRVLLLGASLVWAFAAVAGNTGVADAQSRYQRERAACMNGQSNQDRATCLREAGAAFDQAKRHGLDDGAAPYARNALQRCEGLPDEDRAACVARMQGQGSVSGSAAAGGILRELEVTTPNVPATGPPSDASPSR
jgi:hypothetical protein